MIAEAFSKDRKNPTPAYYERTMPAGSKLDIYAICRLYDVTDPAIFHAVKKLLRAGRGSGGKSRAQDVSEARDSLSRFLELEDAKSVADAGTDED